MLTLTLQRSGQTPSTENSVLSTLSGAPPPAVAPFDAAKAKEHQAAWAKHLGVPVEITNSIGMKLVLIPPGEFTMGSPKELIDEELKTAPKGDTWYLEHLPGEGPQHRARITRPFYFGVYLVTQQEYERVMGTNPSEFSTTGKSKGKVAGQDTKRFPVESVSWDDCQEFLKKLNEKEKGKGWLYRLLTEGESEYACRGGAISEEECSYHFYFDKPTNDLSSAQANFNGNFPFGEGEKGPYLQRTTRVGAYPSNRLGLCDMHGNVWQWCSDLYDPKAPATAASPRVNRGGDWAEFGPYCRAALRRGSLPSYRISGLGLRLARVPSAPAGK